MNFPYNPTTGKMMHVHGRRNNETDGYRVTQSPFVGARCSTKPNPTKKKRRLK